MNDSGNYGFLTRDGFIFDSNTKLNNGINEESSEDLEKITRSESTNNDSVFVSREPIKNSKQTLKSKEKEKSSWWKNIFGGKQKKKSTKQLKRRLSDDNLASQHFLRTNGSNRKQTRKCKSAIFSEGVKFNDEADLYQQKSDAIKSEKQTKQTELTDYDSISSDHLQMQDENFSQCDGSNKNNITTKPLKMLDDESESGDQQKPTSPKTSKKKPKKPPRNYLSFKETKPVYEENRKEVAAKAKIKRSMSLLSLKNAFSKRNKSLKAAKLKTEKSEPDLKKSSSSDNFLNDLRNKLDVMENTNPSFNIYEKYPSRKNDQPKYLVHIQTREEVPVKDGVPQWDSQSYQYVTHRPKTTLHEQTKRHFLRHSFLESSFIGRSDETCSSAGVSDPQNFHISKSQSSDLILPSKRTQQENQTQQRQHEVKAMVHENTKKQEIETEIDDQSLSNCLPRSSSLQMIELSGIEDTADHDEQYSSDSSLKKTSLETLLNEDENLDASNLFGRSFVLTGISETGEKRDSIVLKHPYLAESTPLRHMAKCLRQAIKNNMPNKLSPIEVDSIDFPPPPDSWTEISIVDKSSTDKSLLKTDSAVERTRNDSPANSSSKNSFNISSLSRRCHSESDLSSFMLTPMKLNNRYEFRDQNSQVNTSRNSKTKRLLNRMHNRIERLKKLSDSSNTYNEKDLKSPSELHASTSLQCNASTKQKFFSSSSNTYNSNRLGSNTLKKSSLLRHNNRPETSLKLFKQLINKNLEKRELYRQTSSNSTEDDSSTKVSHQKTSSEPIYDYLWPQSEASTSNEVRKQVQSSISTSISGFGLHSQSENSSVSNQNTGLSFSSNNPRPISSILPTNIEKDLYSSSKQCENRRNHSEDFFLKRQTLENPSSFLSSTPSKSDSLADTSVQTTTRFTKSNSHRSISEQSFQPDLISSQDRIKSTILEEMQKISSKYRTVDSSNCQNLNRFDKNPKFDEWKDDLRFRWKEGFYENETASDSDTASQSTLKRQDSDETSSGDTLMNNFTADDVGLSSVWLVSSKGAGSDLQRSKLPSSFDRNNDQITIDCDENDVRNFMNWDCDETDL